MLPRIVRSVQALRGIVEHLRINVDWRMALSNRRSAQLCYRVVNQPESGSDDERVAHDQIGCCDPLNSCARHVKRLPFFCIMNLAL